MLSSEFLTGLLVWRKLLWNTKPATMYYTQKIGLKRYFKAGGFNQALDDFVSVVPGDSSGLIERLDVKYVRLTFNSIINWVRCNILKYSKQLKGIKLK